MKLSFFPIVLIISLACLFVTSIHADDTSIPELIKELKKIAEVANPYDFYNIKDKLGAGSRGIVFKCYPKGNDTLVNIYENYILYLLFCVSLDGY
jgi:hypothetical protein